MTKRNAAIKGVGTILIAGAVLVAWRWRKQRTENAYYNSINERDIAWG